MIREPLYAELTDAEVGEYLDFVATQFSKGTMNVTPDDLKKLMPLIKHYRKSPTPFRSCVKDQMENGLTETSANARCAVIKDLMKGSTSWRAGNAKKVDTTLADLGLDGMSVDEYAKAALSLSSDYVDAWLAELADAAPAPEAVGEPEEEADADLSVPTLAKFSDDGLRELLNSMLYALRERRYELGPSNGKPKPIDPALLEYTEAIVGEIRSRGVDLSAEDEGTIADLMKGKGDTPADLTLEPGTAVEWGEGEGKAHGIVMEQDTSTGNVNVRTCEVVDAGGAGEQLSPTGKTIKIDGAKLRRITMTVVGEKRVGPEISADATDVPEAARANAARGLYLGRDSHPRVPGAAITLAEGEGLGEGDLAELSSYFSALTEDADLSQDSEYLMYGGDPMKAYVADLMLSPQAEMKDRISGDWMYQMESLTSAYRVATQNGDDAAASTLHALLKSTLDKIEGARKSGDFSADDWGKVAALVDGIPDLVDLAGMAFGGKQAAPFGSKNGGGKDDAQKPARGSKTGKLDTKKVSALGKGDVVVLGSRSFEVEKVAKEGERVKFWVKGSKKTYSYTASQTVFTRSSVDMSAAEENPYADLSLQLPVDFEAAIDLAPATKTGPKKWLKHILPFGQINYKGRVLDFSKKFGEQLVANFKKKPFDQVPFFKVDKDNRHNSDPDNFRGEVSDLMLKNDGVYAVVETNEQGTEHLTKVNPKLGTSVRVRFDWTRPADTKTFGPVLEHLAGTTLPHVPGLNTFTPAELSAAAVNLSTGDDDAERRVEDLTGYSFISTTQEGGDASGDGGETGPGAPEEDVSQQPSNTDKEVSNLAGEIDLSQVPEELRPMMQTLIEDRQQAKDEREKAMNLAQTAMDRMTSAENRAYAADVEKRLADLASDGVKPEKINTARPLLMDAAYAQGEIVVDLSDDGNGGKTEVKAARGDQVWKLLESSKGEMEYGERGRTDLSGGGAAGFGSKNPDDLSDDELFDEWKKLRDGGEG